MTIRKQQLVFFFFFFFGAVTPRWAVCLLSPLFFLRLGVYLGVSKARGISQQGSWVPVKSNEKHLVKQSASDVLMQCTKRDCQGSPPDRLAAIALDLPMPINGALR